MADKDKQPDQLDNTQAMQMFRQLYGLGDQTNPADKDEEYGIFSAGDNAGKGYKRVSKPSYGLRKQVEEIRLQCKVVPGFVKKNIIDELELDEELKSDELSEIKMHEKVLPLITLDELPEWDIDHVSGAEIRRMLRDFLLDT